MESSPRGYTLDGYHIDDDTIRFALAEPSAGARSSVELVFREVEGYLFAQGDATDVVLSVEELPLGDFLSRNEARFVHEARWGWPRFWQGSAEATRAWLAARGCHVWTVSASCGVSGWIVAGSAAYTNSASQSNVREPASLADWRPPVPRR
jgi:hypothetical protein